MFQHVEAEAADADRIDAGQRDRLPGRREARTTLQTCSLDCSTMSPSSRCMSMSRFAVAYIRPEVSKMPPLGLLSSQI